MAIFRKITKEEYDNLGSNGGVAYAQTSVGGVSDITSGQKIKTGALSLLGKLGDFLSRGTYASANVSKYMMDNPSKGNVLKNPALLLGPIGHLADKGLLRAAWAGLSGKDKTTYSDVLDKAGWKAGSGNIFNKVARGIVSTGLDIALDPTTYLTLGAGAGAKIVTKEGVTVLNKQGSKALSEAAQKLGSREAAETAFESILKKSPEDALRYVDRGGIKFAGATLPGTAKLNKIINPTLNITRKATSPVEKAVNKIIGEPIEKVVNKIRNLDSVKAITDKLGEYFNRDYLIKDKALVKRVVQKSEALKEGLIQEVDRTLTKDLRTFTKIEKENVGKALWARDTSNLTPREKKLNEYIQDKFEVFWKEEKSRGLAKGEIQGEYLNQMYKNPEKIAEYKKKYPNEFAKSNVFKIDPFTKERQIKSLAQAQKLGLEPIYDVEQLLKARVANSIQTTTAHDMLGEILDIEGVASKVVNPEVKALKSGKLKVSMMANPELGVDMVKASSLPGLKNVAGAKDVHIPAKTAEYLMSRNPAKLEANSTFQRFLRRYDNYTDMFKKNVLALFPAYHSRNFRGNIFQSILEYGITDTLNPKFHTAAVDVIRGVNLAKTVTIGGKKYTVGGLREIMEKNGILQGKGFFDLANPMKAGKKSIADAGMLVGRNVENEARAATFLMGLEQSYGDVITAAERVRKTLFDYNNLSNTEKDIFRRIFPFWTWSRKAVESTITGTIKHPGNMAAIFKVLGNVQKNSFEGMTAEDLSSMPEYLKNQFVFKVKGKDGVVRYKSGIGTPIEAITDLLGDPLGNLSYSANPAIKAFITVITGYDFDHGESVKEMTTKNAQVLKYAPKIVQKWLGYNALEKTDGSTKYTANPYALWVLRQPPFSRYTSTAGVLTTDAKDNPTKFWQTVLGINATNVDIERQMKQLQSKYKDELTAPLRQKGIIVKNQYGNYYIPSDIVLSDADRIAAKEILSAVKDTSYAPKIENPLQYVPQPRGTTKPFESKKLSKYEAVLKKQSKTKKSAPKDIKSIAERIQL